MQTIDGRTCTKCGLEKPWSEFSRAANAKTGYKARCKICDAQIHALAHPSKPRVRKKTREAFTGNEIKTCTKCGEAKPLSMFSLSRRATETTNAVYKSHCKVCSSAQALKWFHDNKERHKETKHAWTIKSLYGMTPEDYKELLASQNNACAICENGHKSKPHGRTGTPFRLAVDHDHKTGRVRGLLCDRCNRAIGLFGDNIELLRKAVRYLERE